MKYFLPALFLLLFSLPVKSQEKESWFVFDANWKPTKMDSAKYFIYRHRVNDTCWQFDFYHLMGPMLESIQYRDPDQNILHGIYHHYNEAGWLDSSGEFRNNRKDGIFYRFATTDSFKVIAKYTYRADSLIHKSNGNDNEQKLKSYPDEKEADYPGGSKAWRKFIIKNFKYPERAEKGRVSGLVRVMFVILADGTVDDLSINKSVEYSLDREAMRIIAKSGKWNPAFQNGKSIKAYRIQPITFGAP